MTSESGFVGSRLELARTFKELTLKQLAERVFVTPGLLSHYENGVRRSPSPDLVAALATALGVRAGFFFEPVADVWQGQECSFRKRAAALERAKKQARAHGTLIGLVVRQLGSHVKLPTYNLPSLPCRSYEEVEAAAERCRDLWRLGLGPIEHVGRVAEKNGVVLVENLRQASRIDAFCRRGPFSGIVLNRAIPSTSRRIWDVAHEIGHFVLHAQVETGSPETEEQAHYFAGALMLPRKTFGREFRAHSFSWAHVFDLKRRWHTSAAAIVRRAFNLSIIDGITYRRCYIYMSQRGWLTKGEPHEPPFVGPEWLRSAFDLAASRFGLTLAALCDQLHVTSDWLFEVTGVVAKNQPTPFRPRLVGA